MIKVTREVRGAQYFVPMSPGSKSGTICANKRVAGRWIHLRKMFSAVRSGKEHLMKYVPEDILAYQFNKVWVAGVCKCCGSRTLNLRTLNPKKRYRLENLRAKYRKEV